MPEPGIRDYLINYLPAPGCGPKRVIVLEAKDFPGRRLEEVFMIDVAFIPVQKNHDFSLHQFPFANLHSQLQQHTGIAANILGLQVASLPEKVAHVLPPVMLSAVGIACEKSLHNRAGEGTTLGDQL